MKIAKYLPFPCRHPFRGRGNTAPTGATKVKSDATLIRVQTDGGLTGIGAALGSPPIVAAIVAHELAPEVVGALDEPAPRPAHPARRYTWAASVADGGTEPVRHRYGSGTPINPAEVPILKGALRQIGRAQDIRGAQRAGNHNANVLRCAIWRIAFEDRHLCRGLIGVPLPSTRTAVHPEFTVGVTV